MRVHPLPSRSSSMRMLRMLIGIAIVVLFLKCECVNGADGIFGNIHKKFLLSDETTERMKQRILSFVPRHRKPTAVVVNNKKPVTLLDRILWSKLDGIRGHAARTQGLTTALFSVATGLYVVTIMNECKQSIQKLIMYHYLDGNGDDGDIGNRHRRNLVLLLLTQWKQELYRERWELVATFAAFTVYAVCLYNSQTSHLHFWLLWSGLILVNDVTSRPLQKLLEAHVTLDQFLQSNLFAPLDNCNDFTVSATTIQDELFVSGYDDENQPDNNSKLLLHIPYENSDNMLLCDSTMDPVSPQAMLGAATALSMISHRLTIRSVNVEAVTKSVPDTAVELVIEETAEMTPAPEEIFEETTLTKIPYDDGDDISPTEEPIPESTDSTNETFDDSMFQNIIDFNDDEATAPSEEQGMDENNADNIANSAPELEEEPTFENDATASASPVTVKWSDYGMEQPSEETRSMFPRMAKWPLVQYLKGQISSLSTVDTPPPVAGLSPFQQLIQSVLDKAPTKLLTRLSRDDDTIYGERLTPAIQYSSSMDEIVHLIHSDHQVIVGTTHLKLVQHRGSSSTKVGSAMDDHPTSFQTIELDAVQPPTTTLLLFDDADDEVIDVVSVVQTQYFEPVQLLRKLVGGAFAAAAHHHPTSTAASGSNAVVPGTQYN